MKTDPESVRKIVHALGGSDDWDMPVLERIVLQETLGLKPKREDTATEAAFRLRVRQEIADARAMGAIIEFDCP